MCVNVSILALKEMRHKASKIGHLEKNHYFQLVNKANTLFSCLMFSLLCL